MEELSQFFNNAKSIRSAVMRTIEWMFLENSGLPLSSGQLQLEVLGTLRQLILEGRVGRDPAIEEFLIALVPFVSNKLLEKVLISFFAKYLVNNLAERPLQRERKLVAELSSKLGETVCKPLLSLVQEADENRYLAEAFQTYVKEQRIDFGKDFVLNVSTIFGYFLHDHQPYRLLGPLEAIKHVFELYFLAQKQNNNKTLDFSLELGTIQIELKRKNYALLINCVPLEANILMAIGQGKEVTVAEIAKQLAANPEATLIVSKKVSKVVKKLEELRLVAAERDRLRIVEEYAGPGEVSVFTLSPYDEGPHLDEVGEVANKER